MIERIVRVGPDGALVAHYLEQAAWHQTRALAQVREMQVPQARLLSPEERRGLGLQALGHLIQAQRLVRRAQQATEGPAQVSVLAEQLARLEAIAERIERETSGAVPLPPDTRIAPSTPE